MADLRIGTATSAPAAGTLKLGATDISKIYSGSTLVWPTDIADVCGLGTDWTTINSTVTAVTSGLPIQIVYNATDWTTAYNNSTPAAAYYNYATSNTSGRGLYYNRHAVAVIQPPTGYRIPNTNDKDNLISSACIDTSVIPNNMNTLATAVGNWDTNVFTNTTYRGNSGLNIDAFGKFDNTGTYSGNGLIGAFWFYATLNADYRGQEFKQTFSANYISGLTSSLNNGYNIRFAK